MKKTILITGGNSFIAKHLIPMLEGKYNIKLLTRTPKEINEYFWNLEDWTMDEKALDDVNYIIHLSGSKLNDGTQLTNERKKLVYTTRIGAADFLREKLKAKNQNIKAFISASAIGYYGFTDKTLEIDEYGAKGTGFSAELCADWENAADRYKEDRIAEHVSKIRVSLVLGTDGGVFPGYVNMVNVNPQIVLQANSRSLPWNHIEDMAGIFAFVLENHLDGVYNSVAPQPTSLQDLFMTIANQVNKTEYIIQPFNGQHIVSHKIRTAGYQFKYSNIEKAVANLLQKT